MLLQTNLARTCKALVHLLQCNANACCNVMEMFAETSSAGGEQMEDDCDESGDESDAGDSEESFLDPREEDSDEPMQPMEEPRNAAAGRKRRLSASEGGQGECTEAVERSDGQEQLSMAEIVPWVCAASAVSTSSCCLVLRLSV